MQMNEQRLKKTLEQIERNENYSSLLLIFCASSTTSDDIRRASVITFKIFIKPHSLFEQYRYEQKSDELRSEIKLVLEKFALAFTELFKSLMNYYLQKEFNPTEVKNIFNSSHLIIKIFYDLNAQELPEHYEDNLTIYMIYFLELLSYDHLSLHSNNNDPGILDQVKTEICRCIALYADNYSDEFKPYAQQFALTIWSLLTRL
ncbi:unnamed protein product, partial [Adineta steineri]